MTQRPRKALIIGAGIAGPVAAILLKLAGFYAELYEAGPTPPETAPAAACRSPPTACMCWPKSASRTR